MGSTILGVHKSTLSRDLALLKSSGAVVESYGLVTLVREKYWVDVRLSVDELQALVLACRSLAVNLHWDLPFASQALRKLAQGQGRSFPVLSRQIRETADVLESNGVRDGRLAGVISNLSHAIEHYRPVTIQYWSQTSKEIHKYTLLPGRLEPYAAGHSLYLFSLDLEAQALRVLKVSHIRSVVTTKVSASQARVAHLEELLHPERFRHSWGIWVSDAPIQVIRLRFSSRVAERVRETRWHPTQTLTDGSDANGKLDGTIIWTALIREPKEMLPWIRGWGEDCQILSLGEPWVAVSATQVSDNDLMEVKS